MSSRSRSSRHPAGLRACCALALSAAAASHAQTDAAPPTPSSPGADAPAAPRAQKLDAVVITGSRINDIQERRLSTAAKIVIGREEIERFGDTNLGDVLKRLPGITMGGGPGRGSGIRMRGLGNGYTMILLDGQRAPQGFSIESLEPEQVERIEILRAPTAETGARAIAGVVNIVTREGFRKKLNNVRINTSYENARLRPGISWSRNDTLGDAIYNFSLSANRQDRDNDSSTTTERTDLGTGTTTSKTDTSRSRDQRTGLNASGRLQWRGESGQSVILSPFIAYSDSHSIRTNQLSAGAFDEAYDHARSGTGGSSALMRLNGEWRRQFDGAGRLDLKGGVGQGRSDSHTLRQEHDAADALLATVDDRSKTHDFSSTLSAKYTGQLWTDHSLVTGSEVEFNRRNDERVTLRNDQPYLADFGENLGARSTRLAVYAQDEWAVMPQWAAHAGLRWEGVRTQSDAVDAALGSPGVSNTSSVWSPLLHAVWRPDPKSRDQIRMSLTRTYRSPSLQNLIARPGINSRAPLTLPDGTANPVSNTETTADRAGNPNLKPELATGLDLAAERYLPGSGILSASVFYRRISNYMRSVTSSETVSYFNQPRYVSRTQNVGDAVTQGLELEAKFRLSDVVEGAPAVDLRLNGSLFHSRVKNAPGPDNRLDQQPDGTANIGADYKLPGLPLTLGGNLNWTPGYETRISEQQWAEQDRKLQGDAYAVYQVNPSMRVRVGASNIVPRDYLTGSRFENADSREVSATTASSYVNWQLRLEISL